MKDKQDLFDEYLANMHAIQSGVKMQIELDRASGGNTAGADPKHLRVGVNSSMVNDEAVARLLIAKGVFTEIEYYEAMVEASAKEKARYEAELSAQMGSKVTLA